MRSKMQCSPINFLASAVFLGGTSLLGVACIAPSVASTPDSIAVDSDSGLEENLAALLIPGKTKIPRDMPQEASAIVRQFDAAANEIRLAAAREIRQHRLQAMRRLKELQDTHTRDAQLDAAVAIRDTIRGMIAASFPVIENPGTMSGYSQQIGKSFLVRVTGRTTGTIYGTGFYTSDSDLATACVHSGVLEDGERGIIVVSMIAAREPHISSHQNGVHSNGYGVYSSSYTVRRWKPSLEEIELASLELE